jgi:hypothetical protein
LRIEKQKSDTGLISRSTINVMFVLFMFCLNSKAGDWLDGTFASSNYAAGGEYLKLPLHARTAGLECATVAWRDHHLTGLQYNPAILDAADSMTVIATTSFLTFDRGHSGFDFASGIGEFIVAGLSFSRFGVSNIEGRDEFGVLTEEFGAGFNTLSATIAGRLAIPVSLGARGRYIFENIENENSNGMGFDLGATYRPIPKLCIGASVQNIASYIWWSTSTRDEVLMCGRFGVCALLFDNTLRLELDGIKTLTQPEEAAFGAEYTFARIISVRAGGRTAVHYIDRTAMDPEFSFGAGMRYDFLGFDYALIVPPSELGLIHKISIIGKIPGF